MGQMVMNPNVLFVAVCTFDVSLQLLLQRKGLRTLLACKRLDVAVEGTMFRQRGRIRESFRAALALERLLAGVDVEVRFHVVLEVEPKIAYRAFEALGRT